MPTETQTFLDPADELTGLCLKNVSKRYGNDFAVRQASLSIPQGAFACFVGPSGCGKTTLLRMVAGLLAPDEGEVHWQGNDITRLRPEQRDIGMVFQSAALFPHLTVGQNVAYGMRVRAKNREVQREKVDEWLKWVQLSGLQDRSIAALSGGQRQRVAIARALAPEPSLFLLDEPFSALDAPLREALQVELATLQRKLGITTILVTHDRQEAMSLADVLIVMHEGQIQQVGPPREVYEKPANRFVAKFLGGANLLPARTTEQGIMCGGHLWTSHTGPPAITTTGQPLTIAFRQERAHWAHQHPGSPNTFPAEVTFVRDGGSETLVHLAFEHHSIRVAVPHRESTERPPSPGDRGWFVIPPEHTLVYSRDEDDHDPC